MAAVVALAGCMALGAGCSLSGGASSGGTSTQPTVGSTALRIPPPFEVGQKVGLGDVTIAVDSFRRAGTAVTVRVEIVNETARALVVSRTSAFSVFYDTGLHGPSAVTGLARPIGPNARATATLGFSVPAKYGFPLLWFTGSTPGTRPGTIVLRGVHS